MGNPNRTALLNKTHRVLKQHYTPVAAPSERPLLEHLLFALVLENAPYDVAEKIYTHLSKNFFDWNEVRVSTVTELAEVARALPEPISTASNIKRVLQGVFESTYSFDMETLKKQNISQALKHLERLGGTTPFSLAYITQNALSGHAIPLDRGALDVLAILGVVTESEAESGKVSGFERIIPKNKGVEFGSLLHQLAADYVANPFSPAVRKLLLSISPDAKDRFPKRSAKKEDGHEESAAAGHRAASHAGASGSKKPGVDGKGKHAAEKATEKSSEKNLERRAEKSAEKSAEKHGKESAKESTRESSEKEPGRIAVKSAGKGTEKSAEKFADKSSAKAAEKSDKSNRATEKTEHGETKKPAVGKPGDAKHGDAKHGDAKHGDAKHGDAKHRAAAKPHPVAAKTKSANKQLSKRKPR